MLIKKIVKQKDIVVNIVSQHVGDSKLMRKALSNLH